MSTAFEKWPYRRLLYKTENTRSWLDFRGGYYEASHMLILGVAEGRLREDIEGVAALFLFRHYLELSLKMIVGEGRWLKSKEENARLAEVKKLEPIHRLCDLWDMVIADAKPKIAPDNWEQFDTDFVKKCVSEFQTVDSRGVAFRYSDQGAENYLPDFAQLGASMVHVHDVFEEIISWLAATYGENSDWQKILNSY